MVIKKFLTNATLNLSIVFAYSLLSATTTQAATSLIGRQSPSRTSSPAVQTKPAPSKIPGLSTPLNKPQSCNTKEEAGEPVIENSKYYLAFAKLSEAAYEQLKNNALIGEWKKIEDSSEWFDSKLKNLGIKLTGFYAVAFLNERTNEQAIAFEGTNLLSISDWTTDLQGILSGSILNDQIPATYLFGYLYARDVISRHPGHKIVLTGHSLGGGIAQYAGGRLAAESQKTKMIVFNSAGLYGPGIEDIFGNGGERTKNVQDYAEMVHIRIAGDSISGSGEKVAGWAPVPPQDLPWRVKTYIELPKNKYLDDHRLGHIIERLENIIQRASSTSNPRDTSLFLYQGMVLNDRTEGSFISFIDEHRGDAIKLKITIDELKEHREIYPGIPHSTYDDFAIITIYDICTEYDPAICSGKSSVTLTNDENKLKKNGNIYSVDGEFTVLTSIELHHGVVSYALKVK